MILAEIDKCVGCRSCEVACAEKHLGDVDLSKAGEEALLYARRMHVGIAMGGTKPMPIQCRHCEDPTCLFACITGAMHRDPNTGMVLVDEEKCVGCWTCLKMCSFGTIMVDPINHRVLKCDKCYMERPPACVEACPNDVLIVEEVEFVDHDKCIGCGLCESLCLRNAIKLVDTDKGKKSEINQNLCKGCGICASSCPRDAIKMRYFTDEKAHEVIKKLLEVA
ncbi:hypothetical protein DRQ17_07030 [bacterium]|nr:MAG: hypothetical protein DRQ17_07030 [bacterium]RKZ22971.1 MAG: hypothetical protein DRQ23_03985 [bacterium]